MIIVNSPPEEGSMFFEVLSNIPHVLPYMLIAAAVGVAVYGVVKLVKFIKIHKSKKNTD